MSYRPASGYEHVMAVPGPRRGPLRFEEGVATDTDIPNEFGRGAYGDTVGNGRGRPMAYVKSPAETMRERAHMGSAAWIEAPGQLSEFVQGAFSDHPVYERVAGSETRFRFRNATTVSSWAG